MISAFIMGGLGNSMFIIAAIEYMGGKHDTKVVYTNIDSWLTHIYNNYEWTKSCWNYPFIFSNVNLPFLESKSHFITKKAKIGFRYEEIVPVGGTQYEGYFQSYKYFDADLVRDLFKMRDECYISESKCFLGEAVDNIISRSSIKTCSIHVRRGNYLNLQDHHVVQPIDYYLKAMEVIKADRYLVFSDDLDWCKQNFIGPQFIFVKDIDYVEMFAMSRCTHNIIANSSFSYWGAMLNPNPDKIVCCPANWFPNNNPDSSDICPPEWVKL